MRGLLRGGEGVPLVALSCLCLLLLAYPLGLLVKVGLGDGLDPVLDTLTSGPVMRALKNSVESALLSAALALVGGIEDLMGARFGITEDDLATARVDDVHSLVKAEAL